MKIFTTSLLCLISVLVFSQNIERYKDSVSLEINEMLSDSLKAQRFYKESTYALRRLNDLSLSRVYLDSSMHYSKVSGFKDSKAKCHFLYGLLERISGNYEVALEHLDKNIKYFEKDSTNKAYALFQVGTIHRSLGDYENSLETFFEILDIFEHKKDSFAMASTYNSIANIYGDMNKHDEAILNYQNANEIFIHKDRKRSQANTLRNIAEIYLRKSDTLTSREYAQKSLQIAENIKEDYPIGAAYYMLGRTFLSSDSSKALQIYLKAKPLLEKVAYKNILIGFYNDLGDFYKNTNNISQSINYYNKALALLEASNNLPHAKNTYKGLSSTYQENNDYEKAYKYQSLYIAAKDSLLNEENVKSINLLQKQFETEKKDKEIVEQKLKLQQQQTSMNYLIGISGALLLASILFWLIYKQRQKQKNQEIITLKREYQIKSLEALIEGEEKERYRIAKELHDGINGDLSTIKYKLSSLLEMNNNVIKEAITMIDDSCKQVRAISHNLVPPSLENFSLIEVTETYCNTMDTVNDVAISFFTIGGEISLSKKAEINIFRIIQELLTNSLKHAEATEINVQISFQNKLLQITVEDDGKGFDKDTITGNGIGLSNIASRIQYLNAVVDFISNKKGTSYTFEIDTKKLNDN